MLKLMVNLFGKMPSIGVKRRKRFIACRSQLVNAVMVSCSLSPLESFTRIVQQNFPLERPDIKRNFSRRNIRAVESLLAYCGVHNERHMNRLIETVISHLCHPYSRLISRIKTAIFENTSIRYIGFVHRLVTSGDPPVGETCEIQRNAT